MRRSKSSLLLIGATALLALAACSKAPVATAPSAPAEPSPFHPTASVIDLMSGQIDPAADFLWDSVATITGPKGTEERQPRTDKEWAEVRRQALILIEGCNLLMMEGRHVAAPGQTLENPPGKGDLAPADAEKQIAAERASFVAYAQNLQQSAQQALKAIEARDTAAFLEAGGSIDEACEVCHTKFWYPGGGTPKS